MIFLFFISFHYAQLFYCLPALPLLQRLWFYVFEYCTADVKKKM